MLLELLNLFYIKVILVLDAATNCHELNHAIITPVYSTNFNYLSKISNPDEYHRYRVKSYIM